MNSIDVQPAAAVARARAADADRDGSLHPEVIDAVQCSGLLRHFIPERWDGADGAFTDALSALIELGRADPSAGWCAALMTSAVRMATHLPSEGQQALWNDGPDVMIAATLRPSGSADATAGGWILNGQWHYVSGIDHCAWALLCTTSGTEKRFLLVPQSAWTVEETWNAVGLRATGTHTMHVPDTFVPKAHSFTRQQLMDGRGCPGRTVPHDAVSGLFFAAPMLGAAQHFVDTWQQDRPRAGAAPSDCPDLALARAVGQLGAAEALLRQTALTADTSDLDPTTTVRCRVHHATAADLLAQTINTLFRDAGTRAADNAHPLARLWRDLNTGLMHPALSLTHVATEYARSTPRWNLTGHDTAPSHPATPPPVAAPQPA
jgi:alkylation response protein AidB-like acyl-CoA dehydrogenase